MNNPAHGWDRGSSSGSSYSSPAKSCPAASSSFTAGRVPATAARIWQMLNAACWRVWAGIESRRAAQRRRSLRVLETVGMGEKRFVAIVQVQEQRFLVGGGSAGVSLLAKLEPAPDFAAALEPQQADTEPLLAANRIREAW